MGGVSEGVGKYLQREQIRCLMGVKGTCYTLKTHDLGINLHKDNN